MNEKRFKETPIGALPSDWEVSQMMDVVDPARKVTYGIVQPGSFDERGVVLIRGQDYINGWVDERHFFRVCRRLHNQYRRSQVRAGDVLICIVGYTGETDIVPAWITDANITQTTARISCDERAYSPHFMLHFLKSPAGKQQVSKYTKGSAQPGLNLADVEVFSVPHPPLPEQRKIARILTTLDHLIEKTEALIAKYQAIKQGMMHDLFTRGVDEHGHLRPTCDEAPGLYKESKLGWIPKKWVCATLGKFILKGPQNGLYKPNSAYCNSGTPIVRIDGFYDGRLCSTNLLRRLRLMPHEAKLYSLDKNDILINRVNSIDYVGKSAIVPATKETIVFESNIMRIKLCEDLLSPMYAIFLLCSKPVRRQLILSAKSAIAQASINQTDVRRCLIPVPSVNEQLQVATRFQSLSRQISTEENHLTKLSILKAGLMQDLLTGKVRVTVDEAEEETVDG